MKCGCQVPGKQLLCSKCYKKLEDEIDKIKSYFKGKNDEKKRRQKTN